jgi:site-specific DNA recombinase
MMVQMLGVIAEFERATIIDRVVAGMERKATRGGWVAGSHPYGYTAERDGHAKTGFLIPDPAKAPLVPLIFDLYVRKRMGSRAIAVWLNQRGHRTSAGRPWSYSAVLTVLRNRAYLGEIFFRGAYHQAPHQRLVDPEVFQAAQTLMAERGEDLAKRRSNSYDYLLSGLIRCTHCGKHYVGACARGNRNTYRYYICFSRQRHGTDTCPSERLPADELDHATLQSLLDTFTQPDFIDRAVHAAAARLGAQREQHQAELATIDAELRRTEAAIKRYMLALEDGTLDPRTFAPRMKQVTATSDELEARRADLHGTLQRVEAETLDERTITCLRQRIRDAIQQDTIAAKKNLLHLLIHQIEVHSRDQVIPTFRVPSDADQDQQVRTQPGMVGVTGFEPVASAV